MLVVVCKVDMCTFEYNKCLYLWQMMIAFHHFGQVEPLYTTCTLACIPSTRRSIGISYCCMCQQYLRPISLAHLSHKWFIFEIYYTYRYRYICMHGQPSVPMLSKCTHVMYAMRRCRVYKFRRLYNFLAADFRQRQKHVETPDFTTEYTFGKVVSQQWHTLTTYTAHTHTHHACYLDYPQNQCENVESVRDVGYRCHHNNSCVTIPNYRIHLVCVPYRLPMSLAIVLPNLQRINR